MLKELFNKKNTGKLEELELRDIIKDAHDKFESKVFEKKKNVNEKNHHLLTRIRKAVFFSFSLGVGVGTDVEVSPIGKASLFAGIAKKVTFHDDKFSSSLSAGAEAGLKVSSNVIELESKVSLSTDLYNYEKSYDSFVENNSTLRVGLQIGAGLSAGVTVGANMEDLQNIANKISVDVSKSTDDLLNSSTKDEEEKIRNTLVAQVQNKYIALSRFMYGTFGNLKSLFGRNPKTEFSILELDNIDIKSEVVLKTSVSNTPIFHQHKSEILKITNNSDSK